MTNIVKVNQGWMEALKGGLGDITPFLLEVLTVYSHFNHPVFPWGDKSIVILYEEGDFLRNIEGIAESLMQRGVNIALGKVTPDLMVEPYESLASNIPPLSREIDLKSLRMTKGVEVWTKDSVQYDLLNNLHLLWKNLGDNKTRIKFIYLLLKKIPKARVLLDSKDIISIESPNLIGFPFNRLKIRLEDTRGILITSTTYTTNPLVWLGKSSNSEHETILEGGLILTILLMNSVNNFTSDRIDAFCLSLSSLWKTQENYGAIPAPDSTDRAILSSVIKPLLPHLTSPVTTFPGIGFKSITSNSPSGDPSSIELMEYLLRKGIPVVPHKYVKYDEYVIAGKGAEAMGVGLRINPTYLKENPDSKINTTPIDYLEVLTFNADSKSREGAKLYNRPTGNFKAITAEGTHSHPLVTSPLINVSSNGEDIYLYGIEVPIILSNSRLGHGSGVASYNQDKPPLSFTISKTLRGEIPSYLIPPQEYEKLERVTQGRSDSILHKLLPLVKTKLERIIKENKVFAPNETILSIWDNYPEFKTPILTCPNTNLHYRLKELTEDSLIIKELPGRSTLQITLDTESVVEDYQVKVRVPGGKFTTLPESLVFEDGRDWTLFLPYEAIKGRLLQLYLFSNFIKDNYGVVSRYNPNEGTLTFDSPITYKDISYTSLDLTTSSLLDEWVQDSTETLWVEREVSTHVLNYLLYEEPHLIQPLDGVYPNADIQIIESIPGGYRIKELVQVLSGTAHIRIEITSPREYLTQHSLTLEQIAVIDSLCPELAEAINTRSIPFHTGVKSFLSFSYTQSPPSSCPHLSLLELKEVFSSYLDTIKDETGYEKRTNAKHSFASRRRTLSYLLEKGQELFPEGLVIQEEEEESTYIHFGLILKYGAVTNQGLTGVAGNVNHLLHRLLYSSTPNKDILLSICREIRLDSLKWTSQMRGLKKGKSKVIQRLGKTGSVCTGIKVKTSHLPYCENQDGLPVFIFHPDCQSIQSLKLNHGDYIAVGRNPMGSLSFGIALLDSSIGHIGHITCSPIVWFMANQGDSDGDPAFIINLNTLFKTNKTELQLWNQSCLMMGTLDSTFLSFCSGKSKWSSKLISSPEPLVTIIPALQYLRTGVNVCQHYTYNVGNGYGIYSLLAFWCSNLSNTLRHSLRPSDYNPSNIQHRINLQLTLQDHPGLLSLKRALTTSCRSIYEDNGLGGFTPAHSALFDVLTATTSSLSSDSTLIGKVYDTDYPGGIRYVSLRNLPKYIEAYPYEEVDGLTVLSHMLFSSSDSTSLEITRLVLEANSLRSIYSSIESGLRTPTPNSNPDWPNADQRACIYGALRRMSQGDFSKGQKGLTTYEVIYPLSSTLDSFIFSPTLKYYLSHIPLFLLLFLSR